MALRGAALIHERNRFYRRSHYRLLLMFVLSLSFNGVLGVATYWLYTGGQPRVYFATDAHGRVLEQVPLSEPFLNKEQLNGFIKLATESATSFDFMNYRKNLMDSREYFSFRGFDNYLKAYEASNNFKTVVEGKFVVQGRLAGEAKIKSFPQDGVYGWAVSVPVDMLYVNLQKTITQPLIANLLMRRVPASESEYGVLIEQFVLNDRR